MQARLRMEAYARLGGYEGARTGRSTAGWVTTNASGNSTLSGDLALLRERSRELIRNNHYARKGMEEWANCVVGTGIRLQAENPVADLWEQWQQECSDFLPSFYALQRKMTEAQFESGEVLIRRRIRRPEDGGVLPLRLEMLESDYLDHSREGDLQLGRYIIQGVEFDPINRRTAYWLFRRHPGDASISLLGNNLASVPVPASEIVHLYDPARPGSVRGVPRMHAVLLRMRDLDDYEFAHLVGKRMQASLAAFVTSPDGGESPLNSSTVTDAVRTEHINPGTINYLRPGESISFTEPKGDGGYGDYKTHIVRDLAAGIGMPYELLSGDLSTINYSSYKAGLVAFRRSVESCQWHTIIPACERMFRWFVEAAQIAGKLPAGVIPQHEWAPPEFALLDRMEEARADELELALGTATYAQVVGRKGYDPDEQIQEIEAWRDRVAQALGKKEQQQKPV